MKTTGGGGGGSNPACNRNKQWTLRGNSPPPPLSCKSHTSGNFSPEKWESEGRNESVYASSGLGVTPCTCLLLDFRVANGLSACFSAATGEKENKACN